MRIELGNTLVVTLPPVTSPLASFSLVNRRLCLDLTDAWGQLTHGA